MNIWSAVTGLFKKGALDGAFAGFIDQRGTASPRRGTRQLLGIYNDSPWLRAVTSKVARGVAETHWRLYVSRNQQGKAVRCKPMQAAHEQLRKQLLRGPQHNKDFIQDINSVEEITDHPLLDALVMGNQELLGFNTFQVTQTHIDLVGEGFWLKERNGLGVPVAIWPLPPDWVYELPTKDYPFFKVRSSQSAILQVDIPVTEIIYFRDPNPSNPYGRGSGIGRALADEIEIDEFASKHIRSFFVNRARPDLIVSGENINPDDAKRLEEQWISKHKGFWNNFKPLFFSRKIDVKTLSQSFENMQMVELRKQERDAFVNVYGIPPEKVGIIGESKRSTISAADFFWTKDIIKPRVEMIRSFLQWKLVPDYDDRLIIDYDTPVLQDDEFKLKVMNAAPWAFSINQWKEFGSEELIENGDKYVVPLNNVVIDFEAGETIQAPATENGGGSEVEQEEEEEEEEKDQNEVFGPVARRIASKILSRSPNS